MRYTIKKTENPKIDPEYHLHCDKLNMKCEYLIIEEFGSYCELSNKYIVNFKRCPSIEKIMQRVKVL